MGNYSVYGKYYDSLNSDYSYWISFLRKHIRSKNTGEKKLLELGCGTGNILKEFTEEYKLVGIDLSDEMLATARNKINSCRFIKADMSEYFENIKYDVILCLFDSINHILNIEKWQRMFFNISKMMKDDSVFIFDVNTTERLNQMSQKPGFFKKFNNSYFYMNIDKRSQTNFVFNVRIFRNIENNIFELEEEQIEETTLEGNRIYDIVTKFFKKIEIYNERKERIYEDCFYENEKYRWFFVCKS